MSDATVNQALRAELLAMKEEDLRVREDLSTAGLLDGGYHPRMEEIHRRNAARLREIVDTNGWPSRTQAGIDGSAAAWYILQHAIGEPDLQRAMLPELCRLGEAGQIERSHAALLEDRICFFEGRPQTYGSQGWPGGPDGRIVRWTTDNPEDVNVRRARVGLEPIDLQQIDGAPMTPEALARWRAGFADWLHRTGWRGGHQA